MNETQDDDQLDVLMRNWAAQTAASDSKLDELTRRIGEQLNELPESSEIVVSTGRSARRALAWAAAVCAIAASIAVVIYMRPLGGAGANALTPIGGQELAEKARLARQFEQEFPGHFAWLMETDDEIKLGLNQDVNIGPSRFIAVRFVIESQGPGDLAWKPMRKMDFVTLAQETVETSLSSNHGASVAIWTYNTPDGMISVDTDLTLSGPLPIRVSSSRLLSTGAPVEIWQAERDGVKYRVYQAAEVLEEGQLG